MEILSISVAKRNDIFNLKQEFFFLYRNTYYMRGYEEVLRVADCIFCKIAAGELGTEFLYEDEQVVAFRDINPVSPVHILVIPKMHFASVNDLTDKDNLLVGHIFQVIKKLAQAENLDKGYRIVNNCGREGGQIVDHLHFHLLGGRNLQWPPG